jgi:hypothetical protein
MLLAVIHDTIYRKVMHYPASGSFDMFFRILFKAEGDFTIPCIIWVGIFSVMLALGRFLHNKVFLQSVEENGLVIDWFTILSIVPVINVLIVGNSKLRWSALLLIAIYLFGYYRRVDDEFNKPILTVISVLILAAWWTQPLVKVNELYVTELRIIGFLALVFVVTRIIFKREMEGGPDFMYYASVTSVIWQSVSSIRSARLFDIIILGFILLAMVIISYERKSRRWFLLSSISLVCIFLYMSRGFWKHIIWPVYVFAIGLILIIFATRNEYRKKHPIPEDKRRKFFDGWHR